MQNFPLNKQFLLCQVPRQWNTGPLGTQSETTILVDWMKPEAGLAARLARVAGRFGALDHRLRQFAVGHNPADMNRLLDRLEFLRAIPLGRSILTEAPPHRVARLRRQGDRYFTDDLRDISSDRRLAVLPVCALEWRSAIADVAVETPFRQIAMQSPAGQCMTYCRQRHGAKENAHVMPAQTTPRLH